VRCTARVGDEDLIAAQEGRHERRVVAGEDRFAGNFEAARGCGTVSRENFVGTTKATPPA